MELLKEAFVGAFREGLTVFFSPFSGFIAAIHRLQIFSAIRGIFSSSKGTSV